MQLVSSGLLCLPGAMARQILAELQLRRHRRSCITDGNHRGSDPGSSNAADSIIDLAGGVAIQLSAAQPTWVTATMGGTLNLPDLESPVTRSRWLESEALWRVDDVSRT